NEEQSRAVATVHGPVLVFAGAGSGKTRVLTQRIQRMIESGVAAAHITAVTFTNKSAREMKERLSKLPREKRRGLIVSTFHSLGARILRSHIEKLGYGNPFTILSEDDRLRVLSEIYSRHKLDPSDAKKDGLLSWFSRAKNALANPARFFESNGLDEGVIDFYEEYEHALRSTNSLDFDDLILLPIRLFHKDQELLEKYRKERTHYLVDEFQDTNPMQYEFLRLLVLPHRNIFAVGDDDQSIYAFRGSDISLILNFHKDFAGASVHRLEKNYRSQAEIVRAASAVIVRNTSRAPKEIRSVRPPGEKILGIYGTDEEEEAALVAEEIRQRIVRERRKPEDFAVLVRTNFQSRAFENAFRSAGIPHRVVGGYRFFDRREVRDVLSYLRIIANPRDDLSLIRILSRPGNGLGEVSIARIREASRDTGLYEFLVRMQGEPGLVQLKREGSAFIAELMEIMERHRPAFARGVTQAARALVYELKFDSQFRREGEEDSAVSMRMQNISELLGMMQSLETEARQEGEDFTIFDFLKAVSLLTSDDEEESGGRAQIMTVHVSKGLEFPVVFLSGLMDGLFPPERSLSESGDIEITVAEERRLFYVGMTRAMDVLYLTASRTKKKFGEIIDMEPSRFLSELPEDSLVWTRGDPSRKPDPENELTDLISALDSFRAGKP
ncbi:MAG TPA: UvrD-helicase domain-containing protein, partial [Leptospiraceae bacterium]|nr:UvrD-helicase domain-containing protein [Leptospiraceae bacterium]